MVKRGNWWFVVSDFLKIYRVVYSFTCSVEWGFCWRSSNFHFNSLALFSHGNELSGFSFSCLSVLYCIIIIVFIFRQKSISLLKSLQFTFWIFCFIFDSFVCEITSETDNFHQSDNLYMNDTSLSKYINELCLHIYLNLGIRRKLISIN